MSEADQSAAGEDIRAPDYLPTSSHGRHQSVPEAEWLVRKAGLGLLPPSAAIWYGYPPGSTSAQTVEATGYTPKELEELEWTRLAAAMPPGSVGPVVAAVALQERDRLRSLARDFTSRQQARDAALAFDPVIYDESGQIRPADEVAKRMVELGDDDATIVGTLTERYGLSRLEAQQQLRRAKEPPKSLSQRMVELWREYTYPKEHRFPKAWEGASSAGY